MTVVDTYLHMLMADHPWSAIPVCEVGMIFEWKNHYAELAVSNSTGWEHFKPNDYLTFLFVR